MLPANLALVDDDAEFSEYLAQHLRQRGVQTHVYADGNALLADRAPYDYDFYLLDLMLPGVDGNELIKILRLRTEAGVLVVSGRLGAEVFNSVIGAGADMILAKPVQFEQVALAVEAVHRRASRGGNPGVWKLDAKSGELITPDGARVALSDADMAVLRCFVDAGGATVSRDELRRRLAGSEGMGDDGLNATIYRLRRRIERSTPLLVPLQSRSRVGYVFKAPLTLV